MAFRHKLMMNGWIVKLLTICNEVYCMGVAVWGGGCGRWGTGGKGVGNK